MPSKKDDQDQPQPAQQAQDKSGETGGSATTGGATTGGATEFAKQRATGAAQQADDLRTDEASGTKESVPGAIRSGDQGHSPLKPSRNRLGDPEPNKPVIDPNHVDPLVEQEADPQTSPAGDGQTKGHEGS